MRHRQSAAALPAGRGMAAWQPLRTRVLLVMRITHSLKCTCKGMHSKGVLEGWQPTAAGACSPPIGRRAPSAAAATHNRGSDAQLLLPAFSHTMLQRLSLVPGSLTAVRALPVLARQARCYGFGSHVSDNDPEVHVWCWRRRRGSKAGVLSLGASRSGPVVRHWPANSPAPRAQVMEREKQKNLSGARPPPPLRQLPPV